ncbi:hypothetical protein [Escherichia phage pEC-N1203-2Af.1]|nr:hypothetical protein [Escherichia phage pEC-N1203-2Af.1]
MAFTGWICLALYTFIQRIEYEVFKRTTLLNL